MADRDASRIQLDFPQLTADIIAQLRLTGTVGLLEFLDGVRPVYIVAQREGAIALTANLPAFTSSQVFSGSLETAPANTIIADTGQLAAGTYDAMIQMSYTGLTTTFDLPFACEHRNAANNATLTELLHIGSTDTRAVVTVVTPMFGYVVALNERLRLKSPTTVMSGILAGSIYMALRPTP